jgi:hypothetical protein
LSDAKESDNACTTVIKLKEKPNGTFTKELVYQKTHKGLTLQEQRDFIRKLLINFPNTIKVVIDVNGNGAALPSLFDETWEHPNEKGEMIEYPPLVPDDDEERMKLKGAIPLLRTVSANNGFNNIMYTYMKSCFEDGSLRLLVPSSEVDSEYKLGELSYEEYSVYINTDILIQELSNIKQDISGYNNIIYQQISKSTKRDRATSLGYGLAYVKELEEQNKKKLYKSKNKLVFLYN